MTTMTEKQVWGIWCEVWGGVTGHREAWAKSNGEIRIFDSEEAAQDQARKWEQSAMSNPYRTADFRYRALPLN